MKCAIVTGGSRGIGRAVAVDFASKGYFVVITYLSNETEADKTLALIKETGSDGVKLKFNVGNKDEVQQVLGGWIDANKDKQIEILINNAGIRKDSLLLMMDDQAWDSVLSTNLDSFYHITKLVLPAMLFKKYGRVVSIVSLSGIKGLPGQTNYSASKAGVIGATKALAQEVGRRGVTVNAVAPGFIKTEMTDGIDESQYKAMIPMQRFGEVEEVVSAVAFLASKGASYITGEVININGGLYT